MHDYTHGVGAEDAGGWACSPDQPGGLLVGPWYKDLAEGTYTAEYHLVTDEAGATSFETQAVANLEIVAAGLVGGGTISIEEGVVLGGAFEAEADTVRSMPLAFEWPASLWEEEWIDPDGDGPRPQLEMNLECTGRAYIRAQRVRLRVVD